MAGKRRPEVTDKDVSGLKYFDKLGPLLVGCTKLVVRETRLEIASCTSISTAC